MKNKIFSRGVYVEGLRKLKIFGCISFAIMLLIEISPVLIAFTERRSYSSTSQVSVLNFWGICPAAAVTALLVTPIMMFVLFSGYNKRSFCDFYHALPYTRQCVYISFIAAVLTWVVGIAVVSSAAGIGLVLTVPWAYAISFSGFGVTCLVLLAVALLLCGAVALASSVTGTLLSNITVTGLVLFFPRYIAYVISELITDMTPVLSGSQAIPLLSPRYNLLIGFILGGMYLDTSDTSTYVAIAYTFAVAVVYLLLAAFLFVRRKSEIAGQSAPGRKTQTVVRIAVALVPSVLGTGLVIDGDAAVGIILWIIAVIAYFAYEILSTMRWRNLLRALPYLAAVAVLNIVMILAVNGTSALCMGYTPEAEDVDSVRILSAGNSLDYVDNEISRYDITDKEIIKIVTDALENNIKGYKAHGQYYSFKDAYIAKNIAIRDGLVTRYRYIRFSEEDYRKIAMLLKNNEKLLSAIMQLPDAVTGSLNSTGIDVFSADESKELFEILQKEIDERGFESWMVSVDNTASYFSDSYGTEPTYPYYTDDESTLYINYTVDSLKTQFIHIRINRDVYPETYNYILQLSWEKAQNDENFEKVKETLRFIADGNSFYESDSVTVNCHGQLIGENSYYDVNFDVNSYGEEYGDGETSSVYYDSEYAPSDIADALYEILTAEDEKATLEPDRYCYVSIYIDINSDDADRDGVSVQMDFFAPAPVRTPRVFIDNAYDF